MYVVLACALLAGGCVAALRREIYRRSVPAGAPLRDACSSCGAPVRLPLRGRCGSCSARIAPPLCCLEVPAAVVAAGFAAVLGPRPELVGYVGLAVFGVALAAVDLAVRRLPDRLVAPAAVLLLASFVAGAIWRHDASRLLSALLGALVLGAVYLALGILGAGRLGLGDVKLAGVLGLALGWFGWSALLLGSCLAFVLSAVVTVLLLGSRRITLKSEIPFGPFMLAAAALVLSAA